MLPVSGAEQLNTSGPNTGTRPMISQSGAYSDVAETGAVFALRQKEVPQPAARALGLNLLDVAVGCPAIAFGDLAVKQTFVRVDVSSMNAETRV